MKLKLYNINLTKLFFLIIINKIVNINFWEI